eukprot:4510557-Heterocapsa_arctica.AAC.1
MPPPGAGFANSQGVQPPFRPNPTPKGSDTNKSKLWMKGFDKPCMRETLQKEANRIIDIIKTDNPDRFGEIK